MRALFAAVVSACLSIQAAFAAGEVERLIDAMGVPSLIQSFSEEGIAAGETLNTDMLNGQGGDVWAETVRRLYEPARLQAEMSASMSDGLDRDVAAQALLFFESDLGRKIVDLEVQARRAMQRPELEAAAKAAGAQAGDAVVDFLSARDLIERNTDTAMSAQMAFFDGIAVTSGQRGRAPDLDAQRGAIADETESWLKGYYALIQSPLSDDEIAIYTAFWETEVGRALDDAMFDAFGDSYTTLSYGLGQAVGRLLPQNEL